jgi:hypothetical protein
VHTFGFIQRRHPDAFRARNAPAFRDLRQLFVQCHLFQQRVDPSFKRALRIGQHRRFITSVQCKDLLFRELFIRIIAYSDGRVKRYWIFRRIVL